MMKLLLRVNGIQPAFGIEFGLNSPRANEGRAGDPYRQANVSYSLVQRRDGEVVRHTLIDCGMGVVPSLLEFEQTHGVHVVHEILPSRVTYVIDKAGIIRHVFSAMFSGQQHVTEAMEAVRALVCEGRELEGAKVHEHAGGRTIRKTVGMPGRHE